MQALYSRTVAHHLRRLSDHCSRVSSDMAGVPFAGVILASWLEVSCS